MSIYKTYKRLLEIWEDVNAVAARQAWPTISTNDVASMERIVQLFEPLTDMLLVWERDGLTISCVFNGVNKLVKFYEVSSISQN
jgi:hypothetical protein